ncbi:MAG: LysM peptidoglycan-binding domain-containing protein [Pedosphaera sp.]|nr:LysM peptidoglycan-binding domain-containing protein [Pedosphaera sp.]
MNRGGFIYLLLAIGLGAALILSAQDTPPTEPKKEPVPKTDPKDAPIEKPAPKENAPAETVPKKEPLPSSQTNDAPKTLPKKKGTPKSILPELPETEEKLEKIAATLEDLITAQTLFQKRLGEVAVELKTLREETDQSVQRAGTNYATRAAIKDLVDKLAELDKKRLADRELILNEMAKMAKTLTSGGTFTRPKLPADTNTTHIPPPVPVKGFEHAIEQGESLLAIIGAYNAEFKKQGKKSVTYSQVMAANPGLRPERLVVGQKILIPEPDAMPTKGKRP